VRDLDELIETLQMGEEGWALPPESEAQKKERE